MEAKQKLDKSQMEVRYQMEARQMQYRGHTTIKQRPDRSRKAMQKLDESQIEASWKPDASPMRARISQTEARWKLNGN